MSPASKEDKAWLASHYDKLLLVVFLVALLASSFILVLNVSNQKGKIKRSIHASGSQQAAQELSLTDYQSGIDAMKNPYSSNNTRALRTNDMMVSELRVHSINPGNMPVPIPYDAMICWSTQTPQPDLPTNRDTDVDGILDSWENEYGFDPMNPSDSLSDPDRDGFNNLEEFLGESDPLDPKAFPNLIAKLRLYRAKVIHFPLEFQAVSQLADGTVKFQVNNRRKGQSHFLKLGETVLNYKVIKYEPDAKPYPLLHVQNIKKEGEITKLPQGRSSKQQDVIAALVFLLDDSTYKKKVGEEFNLRTQSYKVVDIKPNAVSIRDLGTKDLHTIGLITDSEKEEFLERMRQKRSLPAGKSKPVPESGQGE